MAMMPGKREKKHHPTICGLKKMVMNHPMGYNLLRLKKSPSNKHKSKFVGCAFLLTSYNPRSGMKKQPVVLVDSEVII